MTTLVHDCGHVVRLAECEQELTTLRAQLAEAQDENARLQQCNDCQAGMIAARDNEVTTLRAQLSYAQKLAKIEDAVYRQNLKALATIEQIAQGLADVLREANERFVLLFDTSVSEEVTTIAYAGMERCDAAVAKFDAYQQQKGT